ncbi:hypothetical protein MUN88_17230 [Gracilibacillus caseinilyticus]|uniref:Lipoprotein n=1 Tax=Gracilibacillus caseinilyticus TaxID=2932256 RepID=A0ABY4ETW9_9BACI|nr:hypothetical protein [Gracilibacillus caseinilyticus]UOQ47775.1 hypothetical protein MUN88_17230 [Gracilibacillus caseinilyticus]
MSKISMEGSVNISKKIVVLLLIVFLVSCSSANDIKDKEEKGKSVEMKDFKIKIIDDQKYQNYLVELTTRGKQIGNKAILPQTEMVIIDKNKETIVSLNTNTNYKISVFKTNVKTMDEYLNEKNQQNVRGRKLKSLNYTPTKDKKIIEIRLTEDNE